ncbi:MAG TPA: cytochrome c biogenesis protein CcsA [Humisphaera sp.]|jgi:ABC-type transport system involved in cytochrome c biogenesis permease subunit|nr:cytochrome c biogenesis protein CcsA [Humisphaera sp.]
MNPTLQKLLKPLASLRITVTLLVICCLIVLAGTTAQRDMGIQDVQHQFFHSWVAKIQFHYFQPTPKAGGAYMPGWFPLPGGFLLIVLLLINLLAAHAVRFKFNRKRIGIILIHLGIIMLLAGEWITAHHAVEARMSIDAGGTANYAEDIRTTEMAVIDPSPTDHDNVVVIPQPNLEHSAREGQVISNPLLPFEVKVTKWYDNSDLRGPVESGGSIDRLADAGAFRRFGVTGLEKYPGTEGDRVDMPSAYVSVSQSGRLVGTYLLSTWLERDKPQEVTIGGKSYQLGLRFKRDYKPYTVTLRKFTHEVFPGTDTPKDFASQIRLVDPAKHVDRDIRIWMNNPLRYGGETFYQQSFANNDKTSIIQIVRNPGWLMPYIACSIGALGLVIHFGMTLFTFLRRRLAPDRAAVGSSRQQKLPSRKAKRDVENYTLNPTPAWATVGIPAAALGICLITVISLMIPSGQSKGYNWSSFGTLPIQFEGRIQPLDSWARNSLNIISGHQFVRDEKGDYLPSVPPTQWLMETMSRSGKWADYKIIRIDHPDIKQMLGLPVLKKDFSWSDVFKSEENGRKLDEQRKLALEVPAKLRDAYQNQILDLHSRLGIFLRLRQVDAIAYEYALISQPDRLKQMFNQVLAAIATVDPALVEKMKSGSGEDVREAFNNALMRLDMRSLPTEQRMAVNEFIDQSERTGLLRRMGPEEELFLAAPLKPGEKWQPLSNALRVTDAPAPESADRFIRIVSDYQHQSPGDFNADVAAYRAKLDGSIPAAMNKVDFEAFFNHFDPFFLCWVFYFVIFLLAICSWLFLARPLSRTAYWIMLLTFVIHTFAIVSRIYISGRPPVTNLYSASVFIGWGIALFCLVLEAIFRNTIPMVAGAAAGFGTMLVAGGLSSVEGDTMKQLQAVLDTNFWLSTHVVCVTMGYMATYLAGLLAVIYIIRGVFSSSLTKEDSKDNARMAYGILCFAMLFSFVGTILGGIWADQSWGRFWGWDPKENGAVLVVLWNALILHARWGGVVKERGVMVLAVLGNIVTSWSFFGTNMLGIGLHSYGFMQSAQFWLILFCLSQIVIVCVGLIPLRLWASFADDRSPVDRARGAFPVG